MQTFIIYKEHRFLQMETSEQTTRTPLRNFKWTPFSEDATNFTPKSYAEEVAKFFDAELVPGLEDTKDEQFDLMP